ncbi:PREDICTED: late embryogenesis abundant protein 76-like isoform X2 [Ipomoea nil]|uniref:late embryogenesis abundant protein 76-like isoform X2 n=1 Tax=Ipomoea nil TaxID=35883 RepID=UPI000901D3AF|nr:PREDICTED: late embryogenesis abundant protein 76-like isoform X2 [Ipomoea nil]
MTPLVPSFNSIFFDHEFKPPSALPHSSPKSYLSQKLTHTVQKSDQSSLYFASDPSYIEAMSSMTKNAIISFLSKTASPSPSFSPRPKFSRVCFSSASSPQGFHASEDYKRRDYEKGYGGDRTVGDAAAEVAEKTRESAREAADRTKERTHEMKEDAKGGAEAAKDRAKEYAHDAKEGASKAAEKAREYANRTKDTTKETAGAAAERTKEGANKAAESIGEKAKQTVQGAWGAAKETGQKIKETVVGKSEDVEDYVEDHTKPRKVSPPEDVGKTMDEDVVELRRRAGENKF